MKLLKNEKKEDYHEIEVEYSFLWIKWKTKYRKVEDNIFRFKPSNNYYPVGISEYINIYKMFDITINKI